MLYQQPAVASSVELLRIESVSKSFPGVRALSDVGFDIRAGEVHALVGHNGSGKSTLIKVLSGFHSPDPGGKAWFRGEPTDLSSLSHPSTAGGPALAFVHQDLGLISELNVIDNFALHAGFARSRFGGVQRRKQTRLARELLAPLSTDIDVTKLISRATPVERTMVAIAIALQGWDAAGGVLVLDEPTAALPPHEVERLLTVIQQLRDSGAGILYVSHRLDEILALADRVTVLRDGRCIATMQGAGLTKRDLIQQMIGKELPADYRAPDQHESSPQPALEVSELRGAKVSGVSFALARGEVLGIAGLPGSGSDELPRLLTSERRMASGGRVRVESGPWRDARSAKDSSRIALVPADRAHDGIVGPMTVLENLTLSGLKNYGKAHRLNRRDEAASAEEWIRKLGVVAPGINSRIGTLSGGNQQKVLIGRSLLQDPSVLVLCEPTAGVDVGARQAIYELVAEYVREGLSVIVNSSDPGDLLALCHRVLVFQGGVVVTELAASELSERTLVQAMEGLGGETQ